MQRARQRARQYARSARTECAHTQQPPHSKPLPALSNPPALAHCPLQLEKAAPELLTAEVKGELAEMMEAAERLKLSNDSAAAREERRLKVGDAR